MRDDFLRAVQKFLANAFSVSIVRRMGPSGTLECIRNFIKNIDLVAISKLNPSQYAQTLEDQTKKLMQAMPKDARKWGAARKCLNLFYRDALYNFYLRKTYKLVKFEKHLEIPLDSYVGRALKDENEGEHLPPWRTVKGLTPEVSAKFQAVASRVAKREKTKRVHLDVVYWRRDKKQNGQPKSATNRI